MKTYKGIAYGTIAFEVYLDVDEPLTMHMIRDKILTEALKYGRDRWKLEELNVEDVWDVTDENVRES